MSDGSFDSPAVTEPAPQDSIQSRFLQDDACDWNDLADLFQKDAKSAHAKLDNMRDIFDDWEAEQDGDEDDERGDPDDFDDPVEDEPTVHDFDKAASMYEKEHGW